MRNCRLFRISLRHLSTPDYSDADNSTHQSLFSDFASFSIFKFSMVSLSSILVNHSISSNFSASSLGLFFSKIPNLGGWLKYNFQFF